MPSSVEQVVASRGEQLWLPAQHLESFEDAPGWVTGNGQGELAQQRRKLTGLGGLTSIPLCGRWL